MASDSRPALQAPPPGPFPFERSFAQDASTLDRAIRRSRCETQFGLDTEVAHLLVLSGLRDASRQAGVSERTIRRQFEREGTSPSAFVRTIRLTVLLELLEHDVPTRRIAPTLGFGSSASFRRFLHRYLQTDIRAHRRLVSREANRPASAMSA